MSLSVPVACGVRELRRLLREQTADLRALDLAGFRTWLAGHLKRWRRDPVFLQRSAIRDLRRAHPELHALEREHRRLAAADAAAPSFSRLSRLEQDLLDTGRAVAGLSAALGRATPERQAPLRQKLEAFQATLQALRQEQEELVRSSPPRQALLRVSAELERLRSSLGLDREEARLDHLLRQQGRRSGHAGASFEGLALALTQEHILPRLVRRSGTAAGGLRVLRAVTLGAARVELDLLVVRPRPGGRPVEALGVVEVKRNINDLAHGFRLRQENLAWLTGDADGYDAGLYRTERFRSGHFDRETVHEQDGESFLFDRRSFRRFRRDQATGLVLGRLFFLTRSGTMWGVSAAALGRIGFRVATDERWQPDSDAYLAGLLRWCRSLAEPTETPDVLRLYASAPRRARQVLVVGGPPGQD